MNKNRCAVIAALVRENRTDMSAVDSGAYAVLALKNADDSWALPSASRRDDETMLECAVRAFSMCFDSRAELLPENLAHFNIGDRSVFLAILDGKEGLENKVMNAAWINLAALSDGKFIKPEDPELVSVVQGGLSALGNGKVDDNLLSGPKPGTKIKWTEDLYESVKANHGLHVYPHSHPEVAVDLVALGYAYDKPDQDANPEEVAQAADDNAVKKGRRKKGLNSEDEDGAFSVLLVRRKERNTNEMRWALPGGFINEGECADEALRRVASAETGLQNIERSIIHQFGAFSLPKRDTMECADVISLPFLWVSKKGIINESAESKSSRECRWVKIVRRVFDKFGRPVREGHVAYSYEYDDTAPEDGIILKNQNTWERLPYRVAIEDKEHKCWKYIWKYMQKTETTEDGRSNVSYEEIDVKTPEVYLSKDRSELHIDYFLGPEETVSKWYVDTKAEDKTDKERRLWIDHAVIILEALKDLQEQSHCQPVLLELLPEEFSPTQLRYAWEDVMYPQTFNDSNFSRNRLKDKGIITLARPDEVDTYVKTKSSGEERVINKKGTLYKLDMNYYLKQLLDNLSAI